MEKAYNFGLNTIMKVGSALDKELRESGITDKAELRITVNDDFFRKTDEDLFYRLGNGGEYVPSDNEVDVNFDLVRIKIKKSGD